MGLDCLTTIKGAKMIIAAYKQISITLLGIQLKTFVTTDSGYCKINVLLESYGALYVPMGTSGR